MLTERANAICLLRILQDYSDAEHILPMREIISKLRAVYDLTVDRRTVYSAVELLITLGYDISNFEDNGKGYYLRERAFEESEVRLLMDAVFSFPFISAKQTNDLVKKLQTQVSIPQRRHYGHLHSIRRARKTNNKSVFLNIELLEEAISRRVQIRFDYMQYGLNKQLCSRRQCKYVVEPYAMVCANEHYYLICRYVGYENFSFYRIDLIQGIELTQMPAEPSESWRETVEKSVYAFTGKPEQIKLRCRNYIIGDILDKFGCDVKIDIDGEDYFFASFTAVPFGLEFWALQYLPHVEVIKPQHLRDSICDQLQHNPYFDTTETDR